MKTIIFSLLLLVSGYGWSQSDKSLFFSASYGVNCNSVSVAYKYAKESMAEGIFSVSHNKSRKTMTMLYEEQYRLFKVQGLDFYYGVGLHAAVMISKQMNLIPVEPTRGRGAQVEPVITTVTIHKWIAGADAIAGLRYQFSKAPVLLFVSFKPYIDCINAKGSMVEGGVGVMVKIK